jgi:hypothetical protein
MFFEIIDSFFILPKRTNLHVYYCTRQEASLALPKFPPASPPLFPTTCARIAPCHSLGGGVAAIQVPSRPCSLLLPLPVCAACFQTADRVSELPYFADF